MQLDDRHVVAWPCDDRILGSSGSVCLVGERPHRRQIRTLPERGRLPRSRVRLTVHSDEDLGLVLSYHSEGDPANYSSVSIINDTPNPVVVDSCIGGYCHPQYLPQRLAPGGRFSDDAGCGVSCGDMTSWRVRTANGRLLGYIAVDSPRSEQGLVFDVSQAAPDRRTPTRGRS